MSFQVVPGAKNLPTIQEMEEMWVQHLSGEDLLEEERATHSSVITRKIPWTKEPAALQACKELDTAVQAYHPKES